jgi:hypothetical protein
MVVQVWGFEGWVGVFLYRGDPFFRMGRGCEITKHLKIAHGHLFYYSNVFDVGMFVWETMVGWWLYEDASDGSYHPCRPSGPRNSSKEPATTTEGQGQERSMTVLRVERLKSVATEPSRWSSSKFSEQKTRSHGAHRGAIRSTYHSLPLSIWTLT